MTARAPAWFERKYINGAIHVLQASGYATRGLFQQATNIKGNEVVWKVAGSGEATPMSTAIERRPTLNADRTTVAGTMAPWEANEDIQCVDLEQMSENETQVAQETCGMAIGRAFDVIPIRAMDAALAAIPTIGNGTVLMTVNDLLESQTQIMQPGLPPSFEINVLVPIRTIAALMLSRAFANADYIQDSPLLKKLGARNYLGMKIIPLPDSYFVSTAVNSLDGYMFLKQAVGFATPTDADGKIAAATRIDYIAREKVWHAANTMMACSAVILPPGIRRLRFLNTGLPVSGL